MKKEKSITLPFNLKHSSILFFLLVVVCSSAYSQKEPADKVKDTANKKVISNKDAILLDSITMQLKMIDAELIYNTANEKKAVGNYSAAITDYDKAIDINPRHEGAYLFRGFCQLKLGNLAEAMAGFGKTIELNPDSYLGNYYRGLTKLQLKDYTGAIADFTRVVEINPKSGEGYYSRGLAYLILKDNKNSCIDMNKSAQLNYTKAFEILKDYCQ